MKAALARCWLRLLAAPPLQAQEPPFPQKGADRDHGAVPGGLVGRRHRAPARRRHGEAARRRSVIVVNRPGAGGAIGYKYVAAQKPDGYSLVWNSNSISTTYHSGHAARSTTGPSTRWRACWSSRRCSRCAATRSGRRWAISSPTRRRGRSRSRSAIRASAATRTSPRSRCSRPPGPRSSTCPFGAAQVVPSLLGGQVDALVQLPAALSALRQVRAGAPARRADAEARPGAAGRAHRARAGRRRGARSLARHRGAERHARSRSSRRSRRRSGRPPKAPISRRRARNSACARRSCRRTSSAS